MQIEKDLMFRSTAARLQREFEGIFGVETIERLIAETYDELYPTARIKTYVPVFTERFTRDRLRALALIKGAIESEVPEVLFVCVHNAGRSQMAAALLDHHAQGRVHVLSAGSTPTSEVNPAVVEAMSEIGIDISKEFPKPLTDEITRAADVLVTMGCGDACPVYPGKRYLDWELDDPEGQGIEKVRQIRDEIDRRVVSLLEELVPAKRSG